MGTKEMKNIIKMNSKTMLSDVICTTSKYNMIYIYKIYKNRRLVMKTTKIDIVLDWLVANGYLCETRFRLTVQQRQLLIQNIWKYIGLILMSTFILTISLVITTYWLSGLGIRW